MKEQKDRKKNVNPAKELKLVSAGNLLIKAMDPTEDLEIRLCIQEVINQVNTDLIKNPDQRLANIDRLDCLQIDPKKFGTFLAEVIDLEGREGKLLSDFAAYIFLEVVIRPKNIELMKEASLMLSNSICEGQIDKAISLYNIITKFYSPSSNYKEKILEFELMLCEGAYITLLDGSKNSKCHWIDVILQEAETKLGFNNRTNMMGDVINMFLEKTPDFNKIQLLGYVAKQLFLLRSHEGTREFVSSMRLGSANDTDIFFSLLKIDDKQVRDEIELQLSFYNESARLLIEYIIGERAEPDFMRNYIDQVKIDEELCSSGGRLVSIEDRRVFNPFVGVGEIFTIGCTGHPRGLPWKVKGLRGYEGVLDKLRKMLKENSSDLSPQGAVLFLVAFLLKDTERPKKVYGTELRDLSDVAAMREFVLRNTLATMPPCGYEIVFDPKSNFRKDTGIETVTLKLVPVYRAIRATVKISGGVELTFFIAGSNKKVFSIGEGGEGDLFDLETVPNNGGTRVRPNDIYSLGSLVGEPNSVEAIRFLLAMLHKVICNLNITKETKNRRVPDSGGQASQEEGSSRVHHLRFYKDMPDSDRKRSCASQKQIVTAAKFGVDITTVAKASGFTSTDPETGKTLYHVTFVGPSRRWSQDQIDRLKPITIEI